MGFNRVKSGYLPSLDGWRAVAILGVIMTHDMVWHIGRYSDEQWKGLGGNGVMLFFAISGLLICGRILEDEAAIGYFNIKHFYIRRLLRIQPPALCYLMVIAILMIAGVVHDTWRGWFGSLLLYQNYILRAHYPTPIPPSGFTGHFWSLSVEEHFYILLSLFMFFIRRRRLEIMGIILVAVVVSQHFARTHGFYHEDVSTRQTFWMIHFLIFPSFLALALRKKGIRNAVSRYLHPWVAFSGILLLACVHSAIHFGFNHKPHLLAETGNIVTAFPIFLMATMIHPRSLTTRFLELPPLRYVGRLSYSIYLWFILFFSAKEPPTHITWPPLVAAGHVPWRYIGTIVCALLSYYLIERPAIRLGHKLAPPATAGHADLAVEPAATSNIGHIPSESIA